MKRLVPLAGLVALLSLPACAFGSTPHGVVLSLSAKHHQLQLIDARHVVHAYHYDGRLPALQPGSQVRFQRAGVAIRNVTRTGSRVRSLAFLGQVLGSTSNSLTVTVGGGGTVTLSPRSTWLVSSVAINLRTDAKAIAASAGASASSFDPGLVVLVTETLGGRGTVAVRPAGPSSPGVAGEHHASGVVTNLVSHSFLLKTSGGLSVGLQISGGARTSATLLACDAVAVSYHQHAAQLIADKVQIRSVSAAGGCAGGNSGGSGGAGGSGSGSGGTGGGAGGGGTGGGGGGTGGGGTGGGGSSPQDVIGTVTSLSPTAVTITASQGTMSFIVDDPSITDGFLVGDQVDVTYGQLSNGKLDASDVEYNELDSLGNVSAVSSTSLTITDQTTGQPDIFTDNTGDGMFDGLTVGQQIDVTYHLNNGHPVVDAAG